jgi:hypothetical protein
MPSDKCRIANADCRGRMVKDLCIFHDGRARRGQSLTAPKRRPRGHRMLCSAPECQNRATRNPQLCETHALRLAKGQDLATPVRTKRGKGAACKVPARGGRGMCPMHYERDKKGTPLDAPHHNDVHKWVKISGAHARCRALWGPASQYQCVACENAAADWAYDGTDPGYLLSFDRHRGLRYSIYPEFYMPMCKRCHGRRDKREAADELYTYRLWQYQTGLSLGRVDAAA